MELARWDEPLLVRRCQEGSEAAFAELVRRHRPRLFTLAYRLTSDRETAEDVVQETFVAAFRALDRFEPRPSLSAWLNTILLRLAGRAAAKVGARPRASLDAVADDDALNQRLAEASDMGDSDPHAAAEAAEVRREVAAAIGALPFKYRAAVVTRFVMGLDYAEAAASLEMGLNTYKSHLLRGTRMLREALAPLGSTSHEIVRDVSELPARAEVQASSAVAGSTAAPAGALISAIGSHSGGSRSAASGRPERTPALSSGARNFAEPRGPRFSDRLPKEKPIRG